MTVLAGRPLAAWLAMCFGLCLRPDYSAVPNREPRDAAEAQRPKKPTTSWRDMPLVSKYELIKKIGKGGFSEIWLARRRHEGGGGGADGGDGEAVVLKVVQLCDPDLEQEEVATLLAEATLLRNLDCPYLVKCYDKAVTDDWLVMVLEHLSGGEIMDHLHKVNRYTEAEAAKLFAQIVSAISYLHNLNLVHRDIKPENIMFEAPVEECEAVGRPLRAKLIDLGMALVYDPNKPIRGCVGTPGFVSPELWHDKPHTPACDIYALGVVLFVMLTGRKPHSGADIRLMTYCNKSIREAPGLKDERFLSLSPSARELLLAMLADDPAGRPSCMEVLSHPFIAAVDSNKEAHREMEASVRRRMRELVQLRRLHGLRYALQAHKPQGADHLAFLHVLDQRRLKLNGGSYARASDANGGAFGRASLGDGGLAFLGRPSTAEGGGGPGFARSSLATSYASPPPMCTIPVGLNGPPPAAPAPAAAETPVLSSAAGPVLGAFAPPFVRASLDSRGGGGGGGGRASLQPDAAPTATALLSAPQPGGTATGAQIVGSQQGRPPMPPTSQSTTTPGESRCGTPAAVTELSRCESDAAASDHQARRPPVETPAAASGQASAVGSATASKKRVAIDPMAIVNALPTLQHCKSADAVTFGRLAAGAALRHASGGGGGGRGGSVGGDSDGAPPLDGGSPPQARAALAEQALLGRCMSANPDTLELLGRQASLRRLLDEVCDPVQPQTLEQLRGSAAGYLPPLPQ